MSVFMNTNPSFWFRSWLVMCVLWVLVAFQSKAQTDCTSFTAGPNATTSRQTYKLTNAPAGATWRTHPANPTSATINASTGQVSGMTKPDTYTFVLTRPVASNSIATGNGVYAFVPGDETKFGPVLKSIDSFSGPEYLDNGQIKVGVDYKYGGAITFLSSSTGPNLVNNFDHGRQAQIAAYDGPVPYLPDGVEYVPQWSGIGYNPIQAGDAYGNKSQVVAFERRNNLIYVKTIGKQFALKNKDGETYIEHWLRLSGNSVKVHARVTMFRTDDKTQYLARDQEFPCIYLNADYRNIWGYRGSKPFTNDALSQQGPPMDFENIDITEQWMAATDNNGFGAALYVPGNYLWRKGYFGSDYAGNEFSNDASYIGATWFHQFDHNSSVEWDYEFVVGNINDMRSYIYSQANPTKGPNYRFDTDRKGWFFFEAHDSGWPIQGKLDVKLQNGKQNQVKSPAAFWRGKDIKKIYVRASFQTKNSKFRFFWRRWDDYEFLPMDSRFYDFAIQNDNQFRTYELDMTNRSGWTEGDIRQILLQPVQDGSNQDGYMQVEWVSTDPNGPPAVTKQNTTTNVTAACSSTVSIKVAPQPNAGPDVLLSCTGTAAPTTAKLLAAPDGMTWAITGQPANATASITSSGLVSGLTQPGTYTLTLTNTDFSTFTDITLLTVPNCQAKTIALGYFVFADNGTGGGKANDGRLNGTEGGLLNIALTIYTDPNKDGNPADGVVAGQGLTDKRGFNRFTGLVRGTAYLIGVDASNFAAGGPLAGFQRSAVAQQNPANGVNNGLVVSPIYGVLSSPIVIPTLPVVKTNTSADPNTGASAIADDEELIVSFGFTPECWDKHCVPIRIRRL
jgi:hypothetical protein